MNIKTDERMPFSVVNILFLLIVCTPKDSKNNSR
jgi:hypothetical protein